MFSGSNTGGFTSAFISRREGGVIDRLTNGNSSTGWEKFGIAIVEIMGQVVSAQNGAIETIP